MIDNRRFLSLEGPEGAGKSTAAHTIRDWLVARGAHVVMTREPGGTPLAEEIRTLFLAARDEPVAELTELLLVFAARAQHLDRVIRPALAAGHWVVCDRFTDATFAYQGAGRGIDAARIAELATLTHGDLWPSTTFLLDLPAATGLGRITGALDRMEQSGATFLERVRDGYARRAAAEPARFVAIDAGQPLDGVTAALVAALAQRCGPGL